MKYFSVFALLLIVAAALISVSEGAFCPCDLSNKEQICGTNGVTYKNRCEFECTQRDYKKLGRTLNIAKSGPCQNAMPSF